MPTCPARARRRCEDHARGDEDREEQLASVATDKRRQKVGHHGGSDTHTLHWCAPLKLWVLFQKLDNRYWNAFGIQRPDPEKSLQITVEVNPPLEGIERKMGGAFARDPRQATSTSFTAGASAGGRRASVRNSSGAASAGGCRCESPTATNPAASSSSGGWERRSFRVTSRASCTKWDESRLRRARDERARPQWVECGAGTPDDVACYGFASAST